MVDFMACMARRVPTIDARPARLEKKSRRRPVLLQPRIHPVKKSMNSGSSSSPNWPAGAHLDVGSGHHLWWCEGGDPRGRAVLVLHGGPGGASRLDTVRWFNGLAVRWIVFDQRGCGRSTPAGSTVANDLAALVADAEALRRHLGIERWAIVGGSWGARVALACVASQPGRVEGLFLRSPFLASPAEAARYAARWGDWLGEPGIAWLGPVRHSAFRRLFQDGTVLTDGAWSLADDEAVARAWSAYDDAQSVPGGVAATAARFTAERLPAASAELHASWRVHAHYASTAWGEASAPRVDPGRWLEHVAPQPLAGPVAIVWGDADATCDPAAARSLARHWPQALAREVPGAGHRMSDARLAPALAEEVRAWVGRLD